jgi:ribosomal protein S18 acetylase RimI-like enzyme
MDRPGFIIRPFRREDEARVVDLWSVCFPGEPSWNDPHAVIDRKCKVQPELFLVGLLGDDLICSVMGGFDGFRGWVYHLATAPSHRQQGLGRRMMAEIERQLENLDCTKVNLQVRASNKAVIAFYNALGYESEDRASLGKHLGKRPGESER